MRKILADVRELEHPEPLEKVMALVKNLQMGEYIHMIHRKTPRPLFNILKQNGFGYHFKEIEGKVDIYIYFKKDIAVKEALANV